MPLHLPESYWNDVNRYCGEILAGVETERTSLFVVGATIQEATWEAEAANTTAVLQQGVVHYLGGLLRMRPTHTLSLKEPTPGTDKKVDYREYPLTSWKNAEVIKCISYLQVQCSAI